jgi:D-alanyl-lipoteichoic acid acyltransferase DltB (MBOAT superfamily)
MLELWADPPFEIFRLSKYLLGPPGIILFLIAVPVLLAAPARAFRPLLVASSLALLAFCWGPTFTLLLLALLSAAYPLVNLRALSSLACFLIVETAYLALFYLPLASLPVLSDPRFPAVYPGLLSDRELVFYTGLAFTNLRYLHLVVVARRAGPWHPVPFPRYLLYLTYGPTYRLGPYVECDRFDAAVDSARESRSARQIGLGLAEVALGAVLFELVVKGIDTWFFKSLSPPDDGSYWYLSFFENPPQSWWLTLLGIYLLALRYYLLIKAYSHVAAGLSRAIGIPLPANMNWPVTSTNLVEFWRRYHVTVSQFVQHHILAPVGGATGKPAAAVLAAFLFMAFWHRPALHTVVWALLQVAGIGILMGWRSAAARQPLLQSFRRAVPYSVRRVASMLLTLGFVAHTVPVLLDLRFGATRLVDRLLFGEWSSTLATLMALD